MKLDRILPFARKLLQLAIPNGGIAVDATMGNGHDTAFLAELTGEDGHVFGFDVQQTALENTRKRLEEKKAEGNVTLFNAGHENLKDYIPADYHGKINGAVFNLGYLPGGDKSIATHGGTTIRAVEQLLEIMAAEAVIVLVVYHGHPEGKMEKDRVLSFAASIPQEEAHVMQYSFINQVNDPPFILAIEKR
ncbi:class I SAM-dependent methyltransferase [Peribacillus sp. SCS-26]|uniref:class I SAM-dependent methyltransferase n=1 Tax=Paraperibacillus marinus TaxID=3115295 RepID=UPI003905AC8A